MIAVTILLYSCGFLLGYSLSLSYHSEKKHIAYSLITGATSVLFGAFLIAVFP